MGNFWKESGRLKPSDFILKSYDDLQIQLEFWNMKKYHCFLHAYDTVRHFNGIERTINVCIFLLQDQAPDGTPLNETLENLKSMISQNCQFIQNKYSDIEKFVIGYGGYDFEEFTNKKSPKILADKVNANTFSTTLYDAVNDPQIDTKEKLATISAINPLISATPVSMFPSLHYTIILNDLLDASSYTLKGINESNGIGIGWTDQEKKEIVTRYLIQFPNFLNIPYASWLQPEVDLMVLVKDYVLSNLDVLPLLDLANYIDTNITKLPLFRRVWAIG